MMFKDLFDKIKKEKKLPEKPPLERINADPDIGLGDDQAKFRLENGYGNVAIDPPTKTVKQIILSNVFTYFNIIFFILAACLIVVGANLSDLLFLGIVFANTVIGIFQEMRSKKVLDDLTIISAVKCKVIRSGRELDLPAEELVLDDIVIFSAGNQIPADAVVVSGEVLVNESLITGESCEITKSEGSELLSGSYIVSGKCAARLVRVGYDSFVSKLTIDAKKMRKPMQPGMMKSLTRLVQIIGIAIIPLGIILFIQHIQMAYSVKESMVATTGALIGMIPEGLYLLTTVALALSVIRLAKRKTLVHDLKCIETLARVDVLCVDKTGTITEKEISVSDFVPIANCGLEATEIRGLLAEFSANMPSDNDTIAALKNTFKVQSNVSVRTAVQLFPFTSATKYSALAYSDSSKYVIGAPEFILQNKYMAYSDSVSRYAQDGFRVLMFAEYLGEIVQGKALDGGSVRPIALVLLINHVRKEAKKTFEYFTAQKVRIVVISGDNPVTASKAAALAGISDADKYVDATALDTGEKIYKAASAYTVFGRVTPEQKRALIKALKKQGHTVAMTGDGVNDVLALKEADCSVAMASGSDVATQVSHLVLLNSDFSSMPAVVAEGRRTINNIERAASLFLVKNIFSFALAIISIFATFAYPLTPAHLSIVSSLTIGIPSFFLALEPNESIVSGRFLRNVLYKALPAALTDLFVVIGTILFSAAFGMSADETSTICAMLIGLIGIVMLWRVSRPMNIWRGLVLGSVSLITLLVWILLGGFLGATPLDLGNALNFHLIPLSFGGYMVFFTLALLGLFMIKVISDSIDEIAAFCKRIIKIIFSKTAIMKK